jgi:tRNA(fMet)-specific endonuclease VapC
MAVLDTNLLVSLLKGDEAAKKKISSLERDGAEICTTVITTYELLKGARLSSRREENLTKVREALSILNILNLSWGACEEASSIYRELKEKGALIGEFDILIAAIVRHEEETLVTRDEDFGSIRGIKLSRW